MKNTFTKILSVVLCAVIVLGAAPLGGFVGLNLPSLFDFKAEAATYSGTCGTNLTWSLDTETGVLNIIGTGAMSNYTYSSNAPWDSYESYIKTVNIASGVTTIGDRAFEYCDSLTNVTIPDSVTTIGDEAFCACDSLTNIAVDINNKYYSIDSYGVLFNKDKTTLVQYPIGNTRTSYAIPDSVTTIGNRAFSFCKTLTNVTIPDSVTTIGERVFWHCRSLTSVTIPDSVTSIGSGAFYLCDSLTSAIIGNSVKTISLSAFEDCTTLTSVTIGNSVKTIGHYAFYSCDNITDVYYTGTETQWKKISIGSYNNPLSDATIYFISELKLRLKQPSVTTINYGETLVLHLEDVEVPKGYAIEWSIIGDAVTTSVSADGKECRITSTASGNVSVTATLVDENGEPVINSIGNEISTFINLKSNANFWQKIVSFFKNLFGINRIIY